MRAVLLHLGDVASYMRTARLYDNDVQRPCTIETLLSTKEKADASQEQILYLKTFFIFDYF